MTASGAIPPPAYGQAEFASEFGVSRETLDRLQIYASLLAQWQKAINLVAPSTLGDVWRRHFADSAQLVRLAPPAARTWIDLGSGAGFPGLVAAILLAEREIRPRLTLIESDQRKCAFLREVARQTGVTVDILTTRIENTATQFNLHQGEIVSARALAPLTDLLRLASPYLSDRSVGLFLKGREAEAEVAAALESWHFEAELVPSVTDVSARVVVVRRFAGARVASKPKG